MERKRNSGKFDVNGITFKTWLLFTCFAFLIVLSLWILQQLSLKPYYRQIRVSDVNSISEQISAILQKEDSIGEEVTTLTYNNNICMNIYNHNKQKLSSVNGMGIGCFLNNEYDFDTDGFLKEMDDSEFSQLSKYKTDDKFENESLIFGTKVVSNLETYYLVIDAVINPIDSTVFIIRNQFILVAVLVLAVSVLTAYLLSNTYLKPIQNITEGAIQIAHGNYQVKFNEENSYTELNNLADTLTFAGKELEKTEELRRDLLANMSHDIKTPLTTIKAYAEMIQDISGNNKVKRNEHLDVIISETEYLNRLVNDMTVLAKMQSSNLIAEIDNYDLVQTAMEVIDILKATAERMDVKIVTDLPNLAVVKGDKALIRQVIYNFLSNAIKHAGEDRWVQVKISAEEENWKLTVSDHGQGISEEDIPHIWDRYYKAGKKYQRNQEESSGLGLAIARGYLELNGYQYGVVSEVNKGTDFYFVTDDFKDL